MEKIKCKICGKEFKRVCAHVRQIHLISAREYKEEFGYDVKKGIMTEEGREVMRQHAIDNGMGEKLKVLGSKTRFKKGEPVPTYKRSEQTLAKLRVLHKLSKGRVRDRVTIICKQCGQPKDVVMSQAEKAKYCSRRCAMLYRCNH